MRDPICLITGATEGVGRATALELAARGFTIVAAVRDAAKAEVLARDIAARTPGARVEHVVGDLASLRQVRALAAQVKARHRRLDVLVNNAGVFLPRRTLTEDGFETTFQVNYLAPVLLARLLGEELARSEQGRIVNLTSSVYAMGTFDPANLQSERRFTAFRSYAASKLLVLMFTEELARRLEGTSVTANAVHPGIVRTRMMLRAPGALRIVSYLSLPFSVSPAKGARTTVHVATSPELRGVSGRYFANMRARPTNNRFDTEENRARLWELTMQALGLEAT